MSLLLLLGGAQVANNDRTFSATWEQVAATWSATMIGPGAPEQPHVGSSFRPEPITLIEFRTMRAAFVQEPASWHAEMHEEPRDETEELLLLGVL